MITKLAFTCLAGAALLAQTPAAPNPVAALKESLAQNQAQLRTYAWVETTQVSLKGEVKKEEQKQCYYGADGKVQKTATSPPAAQKPAAEPSRGGRGGGRLKENIVENKVEDMKDYLEKVAALVHEYVPPDAGKIQAAQAAGNVAAQPSGATTTLNVKNYLKPDDVLAIGLNPQTKRLTSYRVQSYVEDPKDDAVKLNVTFATLQDGTSYPQQILLDVDAKKLQVKITNSGYKKTGS
jgi:hypothetical protein